MSFRDWAPWGLDIWTWGWILWMGFFFVWEALSRIYGGEEMLTDHLRPALGAAPVVWFIGFGLWLWLGVHLLTPALEEWLIRVTG